MNTNFVPFDTTFMGNNQQTEQNTLPQRCLVALIDVNKLKVNLNQLQQTIGKELQKVKGILTMASQVYPKLIEEFTNRNGSISERSTHNNITPFSNQDQTIQKLRFRMQEQASQKQKLMDLLKRQTEIIGNQKQKQDEEIRGLHYRINELYSIIHQKSITIESLMLQSTIDNKTARQSKAQKMSVYSGYGIPISHEYDNSDYKLSSKSLNKIQSARARGSFNSDPNKFYPNQQHNINLMMDPNIRDKISNLVTSITANTNLTTKSKQLEIKKSNTKSNNLSIQPKIQENQVPSPQPTSKQTSKKIKPKPTKTTTPLDNIMRQIRQGYKSNQKLFK